MSDVILFTVLGTEPIDSVGMEGFMNDCVIIWSPESVGLSYSGVLPNAGSLMLSRGVDVLWKFGY